METQRPINAHARCDKVRLPSVICLKVPPLPAQEERILKRTDKGGTIEQMSAFNSGLVVVIII